MTLCYPCVQNAALLPRLTDANVATYDALMISTDWRGRIAVCVDCAEALRRHLPSEVELVLTPLGGGA